ncbi:MAG: glycosyltransferase, partial [Alphaproteobacteria bacterium]|nr:glycosyltransferase [Alphaproteobacteria bacterium]
MTSAASKSKYICLAAGGTGGHVMPAICIAETLLADGHRILLLTDKRGARLIPAHIPHKILASASPFAGSAIKRILAFGQL